MVLMAFSISSKMDSCPGVRQSLSMGTSIGLKDSGCNKYEGQSTVNAGDLAKTGLTLYYTTGYGKNFPL